MLMDMLSKEDLKLIDEYRKAYAFHHSSNKKHMKPIKEVLHYWQEGKNEFLAPLFENGLILEKEAEIEMPRRYLEDEIEDLCSMGTSGVFYDKLYNALKNYIKDNSEPFHWLPHPIEILGYGALMRNRVNISFTIPAIENEKPVKIQSGMKTMKVISLLAKKFNISGFEDFRLEHSRVLNQKKMKGKFCLSIHPLDYMTMSDNANDWSSCMSWKNNGYYRQGTVEMMNSPCVVVAYIKSSSNMNVPGGEWNNKKWRTLFVISKDLITSIKSYPFRSVEIDSLFADWIRKLLAKVYPDIGMDDAYKFQEACSVDDPDEYDPTIEPSEDFSFSPRTNKMYNDFGRTYHTGYISRKAPGYLDFNYSGATECVCCGSAAFYLSEDELVCDECEGVICGCARCGENIYEGEEYFTVNGQEYCQDCYDRFAHIDNITGKEYMPGQAKGIKLVTDLILDEAGNIVGSNEICNIYTLSDIFDEYSVTLPQYWWGWGYKYVDINKLPDEVINKLPDEIKEKIEAFQTGKPVLYVNLQ